MRKALIPSCVLAIGLLPAAPPTLAAPPPSLPPVLHSPLVIIANPNSGIRHMSRKEATDLFMGRTRKLATGLTAIPIDLIAPHTGSETETTSHKAVFYRELTGKTLSELNAYRSRLLFSEQAFPPRQADSIPEALEIVSGNKSAIAYVPRNTVNRRVKIILDLSSTQR